MVDNFLEKHNISNTNIVDLLSRRARRQSDTVAYTFLADGENEEINLTYGELYKQAQTIAVKLRQKFKPGERSLLLYPPGLEFISAFFGCLCAGIIAVPAYPPDPSKLDVSIARLLGIIKDCSSNLILTTKEFFDLTPFIFPQYPRLEKMNWIVTNQLDATLSEDYQKTEIQPESLAFLQYTSGSTGAPKGVMVSHGNLTHNLEHIKKGASITSSDKGMFWLPAFHDMGLINGVINPVYSGISNILMSPISFLQRPLRWLKTISRYQATYSGAPNFAYDFCAARMTPEDAEGLDLSSWRCAFSGAEPIRKVTLEKFRSVFEPYGFRYKAFYPCYGLAEATVAVSGGDAEKEPIFVIADRDQLKLRKIVETDENNSSALYLAGCGHRRPGIDIIIVEPESKIQCSDNQTGEIWVAGGSVAQGYWNKDEMNKKIFNAYTANSEKGPYLRTEDLGFTRGDELFVTGRLKDMIIIRGANYYPQDIELTAEKSHSGVRAGCSAAFSVELENDERLVIVLEVKDQKELDSDEIVKAIRRDIAEEHGLQVYSVVLIEGKSIPKTSSGKIQRRSCKNMFLKDELKVIADYKINFAKKSAEKKPDKLKYIKPAGAEDIEAWLTAKVAEELFVDPEEIDGGRPFTEYGIDSAIAAAIAGDLGDWLKRETAKNISPTLFFETPNIRELAKHLAKEIWGSTEKPQKESAQNTSDIEKADSEEELEALWQEELNKLK